MLSATHVAFSPSELASQGSSPARRRSHFVPRCGSQPAPKPARSLLAEPLRDLRDAASLAHRHCTAGLSPILSRSCACSTRLASSRASVRRWPRLSAGGNPTYPDRPSQARPCRLPVGGLSHSAVVSSNGNWADATFPRPLAVDVRTAGSAVAIAKDRQLARCASRSQDYDLETVFRTVDQQYIRLAEIRAGYGIQMRRSRSIVLHGSSNIDAVATINARFV